MRLGSGLPGPAHAHDGRPDQQFPMNVTRRNFVRGCAKPWILVVEGEADLALALTRDLKAEGYIVEGVERGDEAARRLIESPPDLVILDWMLRAVSGPAVCIRLRAREATRMLPIILLSERSDEVARLRGFSAGADDFVAKPSSTPELMARVRALLRRSRPDLTEQLLIRGDLELNRETEECAGLARSPPQTDGI
jgi:two-component system phosphate regulon response regulator PhoB